VICLRQSRIAMKRCGSVRLSIDEKCLQNDLHLTTHSSISEQK